MQVLPPAPILFDIDTTLLIGAGGATLLLIAFIANAFKRLSENSKRYHFLNLVGAGLLTWYAVLLDSVPFIILEGIWTLIAGWHLTRLAREGKNR